MTGLSKYRKYISEDYGVDTIPAIYEGEGYGQEGYDSY